MGGIDLALSRRMHRNDSSVPFVPGTQGLDFGLRTRKTMRAAFSPNRRRPKPQLKDLPVLIVDDDLASAKLVLIALRVEGCDTRIVASSEEAQIRRREARFTPDCA